MFHSHKCKSTRRPKCYVFTVAMNCVESLYSSQNNVKFTTEKDEKQKLVMLEMSGTEDKFVSRIRWQRHKIEKQVKRAIDVITVP
jgi:hypothetical protein